jgi:EAL domain-containing protein (putative c-di-GMP-specific phosphodiesterase class I)
MIADLSLSIMRQAFLAARDWESELTLSVNISPWQLKDAWLAQKIIKVLTETGFPSTRLEIEITESSLFDNLALVQSIVGSLKNQGIRLALDDFGTGYSSLSYLHTLPLRTLKVDRAFVAELGRHGKSVSASVVASVLALARALGMNAVAEGIETVEQRDALMELGCEFGQGYLLGRPAPIACWSARERERAG